MTHSVLGVEQCIYISYLNCFLMKEMMKRNAGSVVAHLHGVCVCVRACVCCVCEGGGGVSNCLHFPAEVLTPNAPCSQGQRHNKGSKF